MPSTRRQFAYCGAGFLCGFAGCSDFLADEQLEEVHLDVLNHRSEPQTFHFALEADDGIDLWHQFMLDPGAHRQVVVEPASDRAWSEYHAIAGDTQVSGSLLGQGDERTCLQLNYRITDDEIVATLPTSQPHC